MSIEKINSALVQKFLSGNYFSQDVIATENVMFTIPDDEPWCHLFFLPNLPSVGSMGLGGRDEIDGIFQIDLNYKVGIGTYEIAQKADAIRSGFVAGDLITYEGQQVRIVNCGRNAGRVVNSWFKISVSVQWYAQLVR